MVDANRLNVETETLFHCTRVVGANANKLSSVKETFKNIIQFNMDIILTKENIIYNGDSNINHSIHVVVAVASCFFFFFQFG